MTRHHDDLASTEDITNTLVQYGAKIVDSSDDFIIMALKQHRFITYFGQFCKVFFFTAIEKPPTLFIINNKEELETLLMKVK